jgi:hypothetical protein
MGAAFGVFSIRHKYLVLVFEFVGNAAKTAAFVNLAGSVEMTESFRPLYNTIPARKLSPRGKTFRIVRETMPIVSPRIALRSLTIALRSARIVISSARNVMRR